MCGIAGIVGFEPREPVDGTRLVRMRDTLRHRGPDGEGLWTEGPVGLAHRRLAIVDLAGGAQPMSNEDGSIWIVCNGEIYNHVDLRSRLRARGHRFRTGSDTESIVHLYEEEGEGCVERLRGMFAFALWDRERGRLLLARDRLGIKPLYYARTDRELLFASEIKAILAAGTIRAELEDAVLPEFLATRLVAGEATFFRGIRKLLPARTLSWSAAGGIRQRRYWSLPFDLRATAAPLEVEAREVRARLESAVRIHLMSDVPLGLFLSGGLDSSGLAALMAKAGGPLRTFSVGFDEPGASELPYARMVAEAVGAAHHEVVVSPGEFFDALPRLVWHEDEPIAFASSVPLYFVACLARDHVKVVLTGEGADELFLGYNRYRVTAWNERLGSAYDRLLPAAVRGGLRRAARALPRTLRRYSDRTFLALPPGPRSRFFENFAVFPELLQRRLLARPELLAARDPYADALRRFAQAPGGILERMSHVDLQGHLVELLMKQDQMSMAASIESRVPFLDHEFVEHVVATPGRYKLRGLRTKAVLRRALQDLVPRAVLARRKMGFPVPVGRWLRGPFRKVVEDLVLGPRALARGLFEPAALRRLVREHDAGAADHGDRLWSLLNLELWQRIFLDGEAAASVRCGDEARRAAPSPVAVRAESGARGIPAA
ncbi:MAG: asparagine synthase (glutamine-hydrolyzing) [Candidatus Polarisedimenticolia bacterium]